MKSIWMNVPSDSACPYHRQLCPARFCNHYFKESGWEFLPGDGFPPGHDVYWCHGLSTGQNLFDLARFKHRGAKIVWGLDDDWKSIPDWNPANPGELGLAAFELMQGIADYVVVSTPALARTLSHLGNKVLTAPNLIDLEKFPKPTVKVEDGVRYLTLEDKMKLPVRVVWTGGPTHSGDLEILTDVLDKFLAKFTPDKAVVVYYGMRPHPKLLRQHLYKGLLHQDMVPFAAYQSVLNSIDAHVYLCPLAEVPFNESKSAIRVMESWGLCAAPIATDYGEYSLVKNGHDGRLVTTEDQWSSALHRMVTDHEFRRDCAAHGRIRCEQDHDWNNPKLHAPWIRVFETITGVTL